jgi:outer membrane receptor protein involved in Fe transport
MAAAAAFATPAFSVAEPSDPQQSDASSGQEQVVITAGRVPLTATYSQSEISTVDVRNLTADATITVQSLLNTQPSLITFSDGPLGTRGSAYFRAFNGAQFSQTFAGVPLNDIFNGFTSNAASTVNNVTLTPRDISGINVYRGINNPAVNSYNSLGGTIDYEPRRPGAQLDAEAGVGYGSFGTLDWHALLDTGDVHGLKQLLSVEQGYSSGWNQNTNDRNLNIYYALNYTTPWGDEVDNYLVYDNNVGYSPFNIPVPLLQQLGYNYTWPLDWTYEFDKNDKLVDVLDYKAKLASNVTYEGKVFVSWNNYLRTSYSSPDPTIQQNATQPYNLENTPNSFPFWLSYPNGPTYDPAATFGSPQAGTDYHFYGYNAESYGYSPVVTIALPGNKIITGANVTYGLLHSREYWYGTFVMPMIPGYNDAWDENDTRLLASAFVQDEITLLGNRLHVTPGVKYIYADTRDHDDIGFYYPLAGFVSDKEHFVAPTLGVSFEVLQGFAIYGAYGQNLKFPDISAYYSGFQTDANGNLVIVPVSVKPEHVNDFEAGFRYQVSGFAGSINGYREHFTNTFITQTDPTTQLTSTVNGGDSIYQGIEVQLGQQFGDTGVGQLSAYLNYSYNQAKFKNSFSVEYAGQVNAGQPLADVPKNLVQAGLTWSLAGVRASLAARYIGQQYVDQFSAGTPTGSTIPGHFLADLNLSDTIPLGAPALKSLRLSLSVTNLLDRRYFNEAYTDADVNGNPFLRAVVAAPRSVFGEVSLDF